MKPTEFIVENSVIAQEADDMHRDHEVQMARSQMYSAAQAAIEIHRLLKDVSEMEGLEGWVQSKLTLASQYLESVRDYMKYEAVSQEPEMMAFAEDAAAYALDSILEDDREGQVRKPGGGYVNPDAGYGSSRYRDRILSTPPGEINPNLQKYAERNTPRKMGDPGLPGAKDNYSSNRPEGVRVRDFTIGGQIVGGPPTKIERPGGVPRVERIPATRFGAPGPSGEMDPRLGADLDPKSMMKRSMKEEETGVERDASARRENERYDNARNYQGRNARGDVIRSGGEVVKGNPNPPSLFQRAAGALGLPNKATDALGDPMYKSSRPRSGGGGMPGTSNHDPRLGADLDPKSLMQRNTMKENASAGASSAGAVATSMSGPAHKPTSGVPKKLGNSHKPKRVVVGKGVYDK